MTEAELWKSGYLDWKDLSERTDGLGVSASRRARLRSELAQSERALAEKDAGWFARRLPNGEHWRLYPAFARETAYLDIETTGLSPYGGIVTVVTVHGGGRTRTFVAGDDLEELPAFLGRYQVLVTFNGSRFDVPFLLASFPQMAVPPAHIVGEAVASARRARNSAHRRLADTLYPRRCRLRPVARRRHTNARSETGDAFRWHTQVSFASAE